MSANDLMKLRSKYSFIGVGDGTGLVFASLDMVSFWKLHKSTQFSLKEITKDITPRESAWNVYRLKTVLALQGVAVLERVHPPSEKGTETATLNNDAQSVEESTSAGGMGDESGTSASSTVVSESEPKHASGSGEQSVVDNAPLGNVFYNWFGPNKCSTCRVGYIQQMVNSHTAHVRLCGASSRMVGAAYARFSVTWRCRVENGVKGDPSVRTVK